MTDDNNTENKREYRSTAVNNGIVCAPGGWMSVSDCAVGPNATIRISADGDRSATVTQWHDGGDRWADGTADYDGDVA